jgi:hypothetical protein
MAVATTKRFWNDLTFTLTAVSIVVFLSLATTLSAQPVVLFDNSHAQTAGNADWTITGGYSDMGDAAIFLGCNVKSHNKGAITAEVLKGVSLFVTAEPNTRYSSQEIDALRDFSKNGGKLFLISDHEGADRNHNGWDAVMVLNEFKDFTGIEFLKLWFSESPITGETVDHQITEGVVHVGTWGGTSLAAISPEAECLMFESHDGGYIAKSTINNTRIIAMGDSSPFDDGTGASGNKLYDGWNNPGYNHERLCNNSLRWLLGRDNDPDQDAAAFGKLLANSTDSQVREIQTKLEKSINMHQKTISKCKDSDVKNTWQEDLEHLRSLKSLTEGGNYSKTAVERLSQTVNNFKALHSNQ